MYPKPVPYHWIFIVGILAGCAMWIKFSFLGFWFGWMLGISIILIRQFKLISAIKGSLLFLLGMFLSSAPWLIYFGINQAIPDFIFSYFVFNLSFYSNLISPVSFIIFSFTGPLASAGPNPIAFGLMYYGLIMFIVYNKHIARIIAKWCLISCFVFLSMSVYGGGRGFDYYFLIFSPFIIFGFVDILKILQDKTAQKEKPWLSKLILIFVLLSTFFYTFLFHHNKYMMDIEEGDLVQYKYAEIITRKENASLLNYGILDLGFYTTTGIIPNIRFFHNPNISYEKFPTIVDEQNRYIKESLIDFVVIAIPVEFCDRELDIPHLYENYRLIENEIQVYEGIDACYLLFERNIMR